MKPITFTCQATLPLRPEEIAERMLELHRWPQFSGYGPLPGIREAHFETQTAEIVGTKIGVTNRDGSTHVEEILEWDPANHLRLRMSEFSPPVSRLATTIDESWHFTPQGNQTHIVRHFELHPQNRLTKPLLWLISRLLKRAIAKHLKQMGEEA